MKTDEKSLYSLMPLEDFKALLGVDDRDDTLARFCLVTASLTIEQYCKRRLLRKKQFERITFTGDLLLPLREYPVTKVLTVYVENQRPRGFSTNVMGNSEILEPEFYDVIPEPGTEFDIPFDLSLSPAMLRYRGLSAVKVVYWAGYGKARIPAASMPQTPGDLASACLELAAWNMNRYRGRRIGMTGNIRGNGKDGEHFEMSMPENVRALLEPCRRKVI